MKNFIKSMFAFTVLAVLMSAAALAESVITVESLTFDTYIDENGDINEELMRAELRFSSTVEAKQFTLILASENITELNDSTASKVIYIDQFASAEDGVYTFTVEKSKIASATNKDNIDGAKLYLKMSGTGIDDATLMTVVYEEPADDVMYGDISGDGYVTTSDAIFMLQTLASNAVLTKVQKAAGDVNVDGSVNVSDVIRILRFLANPSSSPLGPQN